jgi:hypothetical protein
MRRHMRTHACSSEEDNKYIHERAMLRVESIQGLMTADFDDDSNETDPEESEEEPNGEDNYTSGGCFYGL